MIKQIAQLIQKQIPLGSKATFFLKDGHRATGELLEKGDYYIVVDNSSNSETILCSAIERWHVNKNGIIPEIFPAKSLEPVKSDVLEKFLEIKAEFKVKIESSNINVSEPDFEIPDELSDNIRVKKILNQIKDKYNHAKNNKELGKQFGRIQQIYQIVKELSELHINSPEILRLAGYISYINDKINEAFEYYRLSALTGKSRESWLDTASVAIIKKKKEIGCYCLERFFSSTPVEKSPEWFVYINLISILHTCLLLTKVMKDRELKREELEVLTQTLIYLLAHNEEEEKAKELTEVYLYGELNIELLKTYIELIRKPLDEYINCIKTFKALPEQFNEEKIQIEPDGHIYKFISDKNISNKGYGFIRDKSGKEYYFKLESVEDEELEITLLSSRYVKNHQIPVFFDSYKGHRGLIAVKIYQHKNTGELYECACKYADNGFYSKAILLMNRIISINPVYLKAKEKCELWKEHITGSELNSVRGLYEKAKIALDSEKDHKKAERLYKECIEKNMNFESSLKDLAQLLAKEGREEEAIEIIKKHQNRVENKKSLDNLLISISQKGGFYDIAIPLLEKYLHKETELQKKSHYIYQIGYCYFKKEDYERAKINFNEVIRLRGRDNGILRNIALCLYNQNKIDEAEEMLKNIAVYYDDKSLKLLEDIKQARETGVIKKESEIYARLSEFTTEKISKLVRFYLDRCELQGIAEDKKQSKTFTRRDIFSLEELAKTLGRTRPNERAEYYLSAAKIQLLLKGEEGYDRCLSYLRRSFSSKGDAAVVEKHLDVARTYYCEALRLTTEWGAEPDITLAKYFYSYLNDRNLLLKQLSNCGESFLYVCDRIQHDNMFMPLLYSSIYNTKVGQLIFPLLFKNLKQKSLRFISDYLGEDIKDVDDIETYTSLWDRARLRLDNELSHISDELFIGNFRLTTATLEDNIKRINRISSSLFFELDKYRLNKLNKILEIVLELCKKDNFADQDRACDLIEKDCKILLEEIEKSPTKISIENIYPIVQQLFSDITSFKEDLYTSKTPIVSLKLPKESYPDNNEYIELEINVENEKWCSPAEALELIVHEEIDSFKICNRENRLYESLKGGENRTLIVPVKIQKKILDAKTFPLSLYASYKTINGEVKNTDLTNVSIKLYSEEEFQEIDNPYSEGNIVKEPTMFYGRDELINKISSLILTSSLNQSFIIYGQMRSGKSSILYHLKRKIQDKAIVIDFSIGDIINKFSLEIFLWKILEILENFIEDTEIDNSISSLNFQAPSLSDFKHHPFEKFTHILNRFNRERKIHPFWKDKPVVLMLDEFTYVYGEIIKGTIGENFMKSWKALFEQDCFSIVLVGQDVMPKFKQKFPNELAVFKDERVNYLNRDSANKLIDEPVRIGGRKGKSRFIGKAIERIISLTAGNPYYIQMICNRLVQYMNRKKIIFASDMDVENIKNEMIKGTNSLGIDTFHNLIRSGDVSQDAIPEEDALEVLKAIALGSKTGPCNRSNITCHTRASVDEIIEDLLKREVIERHVDNYYKIRVELFKEWLLAHYGGR
ncbi:MAG: CDC27 family protein [Candidatus Eremiobacterota bacterium]